jgi:hypothetical protein
MSVFGLNGEWPDLICGSPGVWAWDPKLCNLLKQEKHFSYELCLPKAME